MFESS